MGFVGPLTDKWFAGEQMPVDECRNGEPAGGFEGKLIFTELQGHIPPRHRLLNPSGDVRARGVTG